MHKVFFSLAIIVFMIFFGFCAFMSFRDELYYMAAGAAATTLIAALALIWIWVDEDF